MALASWHGTRRPRRTDKVAAIYTVPVEQQWVSPHPPGAQRGQGTAADRYVFSEKVANADYERVMREYAEKGNRSSSGEVVRGGRPRRKVAKDYPKVSFLMGSSGKPGINFGVRQLPFQESGLSHRHGGGRHDQDQQDRHGLRYPIPEVNR